MKSKPSVCIVTSIIEQWPIQLIQNGANSFTVIYGKQIKRGLNYGQAATEYGACVMHALTCDGKIKSPN
jgi:roadblock/LC7 domain-containing protein